MAYDRYSIEYHLTPRGWIEGTTTYFSATDHKAAPPFDRVETWLKDVEQSSGWSREDVSWSRIWQDSTKTAEEIKTLRAKFPPPHNFPSHPD
jgi:hypothetical protein